MGGAFMPASRRPVRGSRPPPRRALLGVLDTSALDSCCESRPIGGGTAVPLRSVPAAAGRQTGGATLT